MTKTPSEPETLPSPDYVDPEARSLAERGFSRENRTPAPVEPRHREKAASLAVRWGVSHDHGMREKIANALAQGEQEGRRLDKTEQWKGALIGIHPHPEWPSDPKAYLPDDVAEEVRRALLAEGRRLEREATEEARNEAMEMRAVIRTSIEHGKAPILTENELVFPWEAGYRPEDFENTGYEFEESEADHDQDTE